MTPTQRVDAITARAGDECTAILKAEVEKVLRRSPRYYAFVAAMGSASFYDDRGPVDFDRLTVAAQKCETLADEITRRYGSPGIQINKRDVT